MGYGDRGGVGKWVTGIRVRRTSTLTSGWKLEECPYTGLVTRFPQLSDHAQSSFLDQSGQGVARRPGLLDEFKRPLVYTLSAEGSRVGALLGNPEISAPLVDNWISFRREETDAYLESMFLNETSNHTPVAPKECC